MSPNEFTEQGSNRPRIHVEIEARNGEIVGQRAVVIEGCCLNEIEFANFARLPIGNRSFERVGELLSQLPSLDFEMDGSFTWGSLPPDRPAWRIDGIVHDGREGVLGIELKGSAAPQTWNRLLDCLDLPREQVYVVWLELGRTCTLGEFRRWLAR